MALSRVWLKSKITKPAYPATLVKRMRLYAKLADWQEKRAVVVGAPSGYGKSTLISHWIDIAGLRGRTAWLSLDEDDADPHEFMSQMAAAVDTVVPGVLEAVQPILEDTHGDANRAMRRLLATLEAEDDLLLVLDDLQRVDSPQIHALLMTVLELGPPSFHLILIARSHLQLPLARLFAHGVLTVLGTEDLRFTQDEIRTYLAGTGYPSVTQDDLARLAEECEGWVAALQMSVLSAPEGSDVSDLVAALHGGSDWVAHYLAEEVLKRQSEEMRRFLLQTSLLDAFDAQLAAAVTGINNVEALLADLVRSGLFLIGLDQEHGWYRYHHL
ncbi:MAG: AAA family ATPase, partial [Caldilineaceae bacterium]|nr:AAA family ATPase [Caldilineaceae bacterium]